MKKQLALVLACLTVLFLCGCCISHDWQDATCTEPKTCSKCGKTEGEALGHKWEDATCTKPKTCSICGATEGKALGHKASSATCTEDSVCSVCGKVIAKATGHDWAAATAEKPKTCKRCGLTEGEPLGYTTYKWNEPQSVLFGTVVVEFVDDESNPLGRYGFIATAYVDNVETLMTLLKEDSNNRGFDELVPFIKHVMKNGVHHYQNGINLWSHDDWGTGSNYYAFTYEKNGQVGIGLYSDKLYGLTHFFKGDIE